jgi:hypothetical protein
VIRTLIGHESLATTEIEIYTHVSPERGGSSSMSHGSRRTRSRSTSDSPSPGAAQAPIAVDE